MNYFRITFPQLPDGSRETFSGKSMTLAREPGEGFIFAPFFDPSETFRIPVNTDKPQDEEMMKWALENEASAESAPRQSVKEDEHLKLVGDAVEFIKDIERETGKPAKIVAARVMLVPTGKSPAELYDSLLEAYPDACVFLFSTSVSGTWIGASPELLFSLDGCNGEFRSMALAGTRPAGTDEDWDEKNVAEQRMVTEFIIETLENCGLNPVLSEPTTRRAGKVEHICTEISAKIPSGTLFDPGKEATRIALSLSPTPALCGTPRQEACRFIVNNERFSRQFYGGYIGYVSSDGAQLYVNLRSGRLLPGDGYIMLYAGGGITSDSIPKAEWLETERKLTTMLTIL